MASHVSIPLEQGGVFRQIIMTTYNEKLSLNPFGTGRGLSTNTIGETMTWVERLNPFRTGRGLSTEQISAEAIAKGLNPFRTGQGLSTTNHNYLKKVYEGFQSLWNRAVSFDCKCLIAGKAVISLNPFRTRRCLSTQ